MAREEEPLDKDLRPGIVVIFAGTHPVVNLLGLVDGSQDSSATINATC